MMNKAKLTKIAKKWRKIAALKRRRISLAGINNSRIKSRSSSGKFVVYTNDQMRFVVPIAYINNNIIKRLFEMPEQVFGLPSEGPIKLPCDAAFMEYVVKLIKSGLANNMDKALLVSMEPRRCSFNVGLHQEQIGQQFPVLGY